MMLGERVFLRLANQVVFLNICSSCIQFSMKSKRKVLVAGDSGEYLLWALLTLLYPIKIIFLQQNKLRKPATNVFGVPKIRAKILYNTDNLFFVFPADSCRKQSFCLSWTYTGNPVCLDCSIMMMFIQCVIIMHCTKHDMHLYLRNSFDRFMNNRDGTRASKVTRVQS